MSRSVFSLSEILQMLDFETLAARSLNTSRIVHKPTYAGLRLLLGAAKNHPAALLRLISNRCLTREAWRYYQFPILKEVGKHSLPQYRSCVTGSPLTTFAEAYVMGLMATKQAFQPPQSAYSYLWPPSQKSGRSYEYFYEGYSRRNQQISSLMAKDKNLVALVTDIKSFYPSVDKESVRKRVKKRLAAIENTTDSRIIGQFLDALLDVPATKSKGIPIGPEIAHVLGHVSLEDVDSVMESNHGPQYLRYVDDIIIVCSPSEVDKATERLRKALARENLQLQEGKSDIVMSQSWLEIADTNSHALAADSFLLLLDEISLYLVRHPKEVESTRKILLEHGFSLPIRRLGVLASSQRYRSYTLGRIGKARGWYFLAKKFLIDRASILSRAKATREHMLAVANRFSSDSVPTQPTARKAYIQRRRYVFNRLLYLLSPDEYSKLLNLIPPGDDFTEVRSVAMALAAKCASSIIDYPGRVVDTFCQLWIEQDDLGRPNFNWPAELNQARSESIAHMALYFSVDSPQASGNVGVSQPGDSRVLLDICRRMDTSNQQIDSFSYLDEVELLFRGSSLRDLQKIMRSRFDKMEELGLDGLMLGSTNSAFPFDDGGYVG